MNVTLDEITHEAEHICTFWFVPDRMPHYVAGQFIELYIPHENPDKRGIKRWFTLSSSPTEDRLAITTKFTPDKGSTYKQALSELQPGATLRMIEPMGDFVLPISKTLPLVFVAGGMGITPMRSMIKWLLDTQEQRTIQLLYSVEREENFVFRDLFEVYGIKANYIVTKPGENWHGETGHLDTESILRTVDGNPRSMIYVSGPEPMTESLVKQLKEQGISSNQLATDYFPGYPAV